MWNLTEDVGVTETRREDIAEANVGHAPAKHCTGEMKS